MKKFMLFYVDADHINYDSVVFNAKNLNSAFSLAKRICAEHNKTFLGVVDYFFISKYTLL